MATEIDDTPAPSAGSRRDPYAALRFRDFRLLLIGRIIMGLGSQMLSFAIGWELWLRTHDALALGLVGLAQVTPVILFSLPAGHVADQYNRKRIVLITQCLLSLCSLGLALLSLQQGPIILVYVCLFGIGLARAFNGPATSTLLPQTIPPQYFTSAATWSSSAGQLASIIGLTGGEASVQQIAKDYYAEFSRQESHVTHGDPVTIGHTGYLYLLDRQSRWRFIYTSQTPTEAIVSDIQQILSE